MKSKITAIGRLKRKRGQGSGINYNPWIKVHDFSSRGLSSRVYSPVTKRTHHLLSQLERFVFYCIEFIDPIQIREQYSLLPLSETIEIAALSDLRHPQHMGMETVMSVDFLVELNDGPVAISVKPSENLSKHTLGKLEIERQFFEGRNIPYCIITEKDIPPLYIKNILLARNFANRPEVNISDETFLIELKRITRNTTYTVIDALKLLANQNCSLSFPELKKLFLHLVWKKRITFDYKTLFVMDLNNDDYDVAN